MGSDHAHVQGVVGGHEGDAHHSLDHRDGHSSPPAPAARLRALASHTPPPAQNEGLLGPGDGLHHPLDLQVVALDAGLIAPDVHRLRVLEFFQGLLLHVDGDIDEHRAGAAGGGDVKGLLHHPGDVVGVLHQIAVLGEGGHGPGDVHLLKDVPAQQVAGHLAGDGHHGDGVHVGGGDAGDQVGGPRAAGHHAHPDLSAHAGVARGHVPRVSARSAPGCRQSPGAPSGRPPPGRWSLPAYPNMCSTFSRFKLSIKACAPFITPSPPQITKQKRPSVPISFDRTKPYIYSVVPPNFTGRACALIAPITVGLRPRLLRTSKNVPFSGAAHGRASDLGSFPGAFTSRSFSVRPDPLTSPVIAMVSD